MSEVEILAFCRARIDDTERLAQGSWRGDGWRHENRPNEVWTGKQAPGHTPIPIAKAWDEPTARHIARHDPRRTLASVKVDRAMLAEVESWAHPEPCSFALSRDFRETGGTCDLEPCDCRLAERQMAILGPMAARDSDHPDYRAEWSG